MPAAGRGTICDGSDVQQFASTIVQQQLRHLLAQRFRIAGRTHRFGTHGATIGQMDDNALFYLRSRGLDESSARSLLLFAFAGECTGRLKPGPVRSHIEKLVRRTLPEISAVRSESGESEDGGEREDKSRNWEEVG